MRDGLDFIGHDFVTFDDGSYRWVDMKRFSLADDIGSPTGALDLLMHHVRYRDHYTTADSSEQDSETLHGPYELEHISAACFDLLDEDDAVEAVRGFAALHGGTMDETVAKLEEVVIPVIRQMPSRFRLRDLGEEAQHDFGWVLDDFTELVLIDLAGHRLVLLVAAAD